MGLLDDDIDWDAPSRRQRQRLRALLHPPAVPVAMPVLPDWQGGDRGPDLRGSGRDQAEAASLADFARSAMMGLGAVFGGPLGMLGTGLTIGSGKPTGIMDLFGVDPIGAMLGGRGNSLAGVPGLGIESGVQTMASPELQGRSDPSQDPGIGGQAQGGFGGSGVAGEAGFLHRGGIVRRAGLLGPDPPGPDQGFAALQAGERVLNARQWRMLKPETRAEIAAVFEKTGAAGKSPRGYAEGGVVSRGGLLDAPARGSDAPVEDSDVYWGPFSPDPFGFGPRGTTGFGFGLPPVLMAPMPVIAPEVVDRGEISPELHAFIRRFKRKPANALVR